MKLNGWMPTLVLTGERQGRRYGITIDGQAVWLQPAWFKALLALVRAELSSKSPFVRLSATDVCRLREAIDDVLGMDVGARLIPDGEGGTYVLALDGKHIIVAGGFGTSPLSGAVLNKSRAAILRSKGRRSKKRQPKGQGKGARPQRPAKAQGEAPAKRPRK